MESESTTTILIVEDNPGNRMLVADLLTAKGYRSVEAKDGEEAIALARQERPDLILMDLSLPRLDGWEATRRLKADADLKDIPVVALTAHAMVGDEAKALKAGCDGYIAKPINVWSFVDASIIHNDDFALNLKIFESLQGILNSSPDILFFIQSWHNNS